MSKRQYITFGTMKSRIADCDELKAGNDAQEGTDGLLTPLGCEFTIGTEAANVINVAGQVRSSLLAAKGSDIAQSVALKAYLSANADGSTLATAPDGGVAIGTDGLILPDVANQVFTIVTEADGDFDIDITETGAGTWYLVIVNALGQLVISDAITFA